MSKIDQERVAGRFLKDLKKDLLGLTPNYGVFLESFSELRYTNYSNKMMIRYSFEKIEFHNSKGVVLLSDNFTLDHIVPQKKAKGGLFHSIGNLTPLGSLPNSSKGSNDATKSDYLDIDNFYSVKKLNEQLGRNPKFNEDSIKTRIEYLANYAYYEAFATMLSD